MGGLLGIECKQGQKFNFKECSIYGHFFKYVIIQP